MLIDYSWPLVAAPKGHGQCWGNHHELSCFKGNLPAFFTPINIFLTSKTADIIKQALYLIKGVVYGKSLTLCMFNWANTRLR